MGHPRPRLESVVECRPRELILASASPRRKAILEAAGYRLDIRAADVDESVPSALEPRIAAEVIAARKARAIAGSVAAGWIVAADTIVVVGGEFLGKPRDEADATRMLSALSGSTHQVITGVAVLHRPSGHERIAAQVSAVTMRRLSPAEIAAYVASGEPFGKAGAYAIQETADRFVTHRDGDFDNVVGFPLRLFHAMLPELIATVKEGSS